MLKHGRAKAKKTVSVRMPKAAVSQEPKLNPSDMVLFLTYSVGCIALQKVVRELADHWAKDNIVYLVADQSRFEELLKDNIWKVIVLHRGGTHGWPVEKTPQLMSLLQTQKARGTRLVYYIDDFLVHLNNNTPLHLMSLCDQVIAKGYFLPGYLSKSEGIRNVVSLKTWIDLEKFDRGTPPVEFKYPLNILWFSAGRTGLGFMPSLFEALNPDDWKDTEWHVIGSTVGLFRADLNKYRKFNKSYSEKIDIDNLYSLVKSSSIIINPLHNETDNMELAILPIHRVFYNNSKVEIKYILAGAGKKPLLTCHSTAYDQCVQHGVNGFITNSPEEWAEILLKLKDKDLRDKIGNAARKDVETNYKAADRWPELKKYILGV